MSSSVCGAINPELVENAVRTKDHNRLEPTPVIEHVVSGLSNKQIADLLEGKKGRA